MKNYRYKNFEQKYCNYALARGFQYYKHVYPNPPVGALVVKSGVIIGTGAHERSGTAHAEVNAINNASEDTNGADLFVSLEPCNHFGQTPPCTKAILGSGIKRVFYLTKDPTKAGGGAEHLKAEGVEVYYVEPKKQVSAYMEPWISWALEGVRTITPVFFYDLSGNFCVFDNSLLKQRILKRYQKVINEVEDFDSLNSYDLAYTVDSKDGLSSLTSIIANPKIRISKVLIVRSMIYTKNEGSLVQDEYSAQFLDQFEHLQLSQVKMLKGICLEEYSLAHV